MRKMEQEISSDAVGVPEPTESEEDDGYTDGH